jgi:hypothetical protein
MALSEAFAFVGAPLLASILDRALSLKVPCAVLIGTQ